jgi:hypothetical protein
MCPLSLPVIARTSLVKWPYKHPSSPMHICVETEFDRFQTDIHDPSACIAAVSEVDKEVHVDGQPLALYLRISTLSARISFLRR